MILEVEIVKDFVLNPLTRNEDNCRFLKKCIYAEGRQKSFRKFGS